MVASSRHLSRFFSKCSFLSAKLFWPQFLITYSNLNCIFKIHSKYTFFLTPICFFADFCAIFHLYKFFKNVLDYWERWLTKNYSLFSGHLVKLSFDIEMILKKMEFHRLFRKLQKSIFNQEAFVISCILYWYFFILFFI